MEKPITRKFLYPEDFQKNLITGDPYHKCWFLTVTTVPKGLDYMNYIFYFILLYYDSKRC